MKKLPEIIHYYLPFKLHCICHTNYEGGIDVDQEVIAVGESYITYRNTCSQCVDVSFSQIKPILQPLSSAINELSEFIYESQAESFDSLENARHWFKIVMHQPLELPFNIFEKALSLHCDLFGLIESEQAIEKQI